MTKRFTPLLIILTFPAIFTSCTKDYTCTCTYTTGKLTQKSSSKIIQTTKKKAEDECGSKNQKIYNPGTNNYTIVSCGI